MQAMNGLESLKVVSDIIDIIYEPVGQTITHKILDSLKNPFVAKQACIMAE